MQGDSSKPEIKSEEADHIESLLGTGRKPETPTKSPKKRLIAKTPTGSPRKRRNSPEKMNSHTASNVNVATGDALLLLAAALHVERSSSSADNVGGNYYYADVLAEARTPPLSPTKKILSEVRTPPMSPPKRLLMAEPRTPPMSPPKKLRGASDAGTPPTSPPKKLTVNRQRSSSRSSSRRRVKTPTTPPFSPSTVHGRMSKQNDEVDMDMDVLSPKTPASVVDVLMGGVVANMPRLSIGGY